MAREGAVRSLVANAGDRGQVRKAAELEAFAEERRANGWRYVLANAVGRELAWSMLEECHVFETVMATSPFIFANAGRHDWGLQMWAEMTRADEDNCLLMQREAIDRKRRLMPAPKRPEPETDEDPDA